MADNDYSSLRQAVDRIMGTAPGGSAGTQQAPSGFDLAPKPSFASDLSLGTTAAATNTPTTADIENANALAELQALQAAPTRSTGLGEGKPWLTFADQMRSDLAAGGVTGKQAEDIISQHTAGVRSMMFDPATMALNPEIAARPANFQPTTTTTGNVIAMGGFAPAASARAPVNPGPNAPWQQSMQYWKDLAASGR